MANGYINTVPLGREGTGAAQIFGPNRALQYFLGQNQQNQQRLAMQEQRYNQQQQAYNQNFQKTLMDLNDLASTPMYGQDFAELTNELVKQGGQLMAQGINPYNPNQNPQSRDAVQQWQNEVNRVRQAKLQVENLYKDRQAQVKQYLQNPDQYDFDDFQKLRDFENNVSLEDILNGQGQYPQLQQRLNISEDITRQYGQIYNDFVERGFDAQGNPIQTDIREADRNRIASIVNTEFRPETRYGQEVNRRLRREFGDTATLNGLLGTTDRDELRSILDAEFRNPTDSNPIVELMSSGINASPGTPEYNQFLDRAVEEQYKAEKILDDAKQEAANALINRTNTSRKEKFDFTLRNQQLREQSAANAARNSNLSARNTMLSIQKKLLGLDEVEDAMVDEAVDIDFSEDFGDGATEDGIKVFSTIPLNTPSVSISPADITSVRSGEKEKQPEVRGNVTGIGIVAYDSKGNVVKGNSPEELAMNPNVVRFAPQAIVQDNKRRSYSYDTNNIPVSSLSKPMQANMNRAINIGKKTAETLNEQLKKRPARSQDTGSASWQNYNNGISNLFGQPTQTPTGGSRFSGVPEGGF